mgnify:CR=1 FL=1
MFNTFSTYGYPKVETVTMYANNGVTSLLELYARLTTGAFVDATYGAGAKDDLSGLEPGHLDPTAAGRPPPHPHPPDARPRRQDRARPHAAALQSLPQVGPHPRGVGGHRAAVNAKLEELKAKVHHGQQTESASAPAPAGNGC